MSGIIVILMLICLNGIFSMSEIAIISARKSSLSNRVKRGDRGARIALDLANEPERFLSTVQIGITLIGILTGIYSGATLADRFAAILSETVLPPAIAHAAAQAVIVLVVTYLSIVDGQCPFHDFLTYFDRGDLFDEEGRYNTLAGMIIEKLKHIPNAGECVAWHDFRFEIVDMDNARIDKVLVTKRQ